MARGFSFAFVIIIIGYYWNPIKLKARQPLRFGGYVTKDLDKVREAFR